MRHSRVATIALAAITLAAAPARAQDDLIALDRVRQLYVNGQPREAARALAEVSGAFRQEIGRCKDPEIGAQLMDLEPRMDALVMRLGNGRVANERELTREFAVFDQLLAENHLHLAELGFNQRRNGRLDAVGRDLDLAARYVERSARWAQRTLDPTARGAIDAARATAQQFKATPNQAPADAERVLVALGTVVKPQP
jgi:hypothetical protein